MHLLIIGGLGDHDRAMRLLLPIWHLRGFHPQLWPVGWSNDDGKFDERFKMLLAYADALPANEHLAVIGASAGGIMATLLLLARPAKVARIATISSPLTRERHSNNGLLNQGLRRLAAELPTANAQTVARICSFYGAKDGIVSPGYSQLPGALSEHLPARGHVFTIVLALTLWNGRLARWLRPA
jgi:pimeloyl-ACP methyl ester carboxylesterase